MNTAAIVLAAGEGTRMKSKHPKIVHEVLGKPLVWWSVRAAREAGAERLIVVVGNGGDELRAAFADQPDVEFVEQTERLGTGHAVRVVRDAGLFGLRAEPRLLTSSLCEAALHAGLFLASTESTDIDELRAMIDRGVNFIETERPDLAYGLMPQPDFD